MKLKESMNFVVEFELNGATAPEGMAAVDDQ